MQRSFSRSRFTGGAVAVLACTTLARAARFTYKLGSDEPLETPANVRLVQFAEAVRRETGGAMVIEVFGNSQLGGDTSMLTQMRSGALEFFYVSGGSLSGVVPVAGIEGVAFAFKTPTAPFIAMDGTLGDYIRKEVSAKGMFIFGKVWTIGLREVTTSTKPLRTVADCEGLRIRTPPAKISIDTWRTLGASPTPLNFSETYTALQARVVDGQDTPLATIETAKLFEVQRYLSITNHMWAGHWPLANVDAWNALPPDIRAVIERNIDKYGVLQRRDAVLLNATLQDKLQRQGLIMNLTDTGSFRKTLQPAYGRWRDDFGATAWSLLESYTGKLA